MSGSPDHRPLAPAEAMIAQLKMMIEKLGRELYGKCSERKASLIEQLALELEELQSSATEDELRAESTTTQQVQGFTRRKPARKPFPDHLPRERIVIRGRHRARAAARPGSPSSARTSPRRSG